MSLRSIYDLMSLRPKTYPEAHLEIGRFRDRDPMNDASSIGSGGTPHAHPRGKAMLR
jgi:hypothetical protein